MGTKRQRVGVNEYTGKSILPVYPEGAGEDIVQLRQLSVEIKVGVDILTDLEGEVDRWIGIVKFL